VEVGGRLVGHSAPYRYVWPFELDLMARLAGFRLEHRWEGWDRSPFTARSARHVTVYEKICARRLASATGNPAPVCRTRQRVAADEAGASLAARWPPVPPGQVRYRRRLRSPVGARARSQPHPAVDALPQQVGVADVAGVLLDHVDQYLPQ
jgi:hypothetical protein